MKSWRTTLGGALIALGHVLAPGLPANYSWVSTALTGTGALLLGTSARDNSVTSEQAGASNFKARR